VAAFFDTRYAVVHAGRFGGLQALQETLFSGGVAGEAGNTTRK